MKSQFKVSVSIFCKDSQEGGLAPALSACLLIVEDWGQAHLPDCPLVRGLISGIDCSTTTSSSGIYG